MGNTYIIPYSDSNVAIGIQNEARLNDLRDRRESLAKRSGIEPDNFVEFRQKHPGEPSHMGRNLLVGAVIGTAVASGFALAIGAAVAAPVLLIGAVMGAAVGSFGEMEAVRRSKAIKSYSRYLNAFEETVSQGMPKQRAYSIDKMPPEREGENVDRYRQNNAAPNVMFDSPR